MLGKIYAYFASLFHTLAKEPIMLARLYGAANTFLGYAKLSETPEYPKVIKLNEPGKLERIFAHISEDRYDECENIPIVKLELTTPVK